MIVLPNRIPMQTTVQGSRRFGERLLEASQLALVGVLSPAVLAGAVLLAERPAIGSEPVPSAQQVSTETNSPSPEGKDAAIDPNFAWPEGTIVQGRVLSHLGTPVANAEVLLLGKERIIVDAERRTWFVPEKDPPVPPSTRTDKNGAFTITRKQGIADRLAVISEDPLFWIVSRSRLMQADNVEIKLPQAGKLAVHCDLPSKPAKQPVMIESKISDGVTWYKDFLRFHSATFSLVNPGERVFGNLPPGQCAVQRSEQTKTGSNSVLNTGADRQLVKIESAKQSSVSFDRKIGRPLSGRVKGLEDVELREARLTISYLGPEEMLGNNEKPGRFYVAFDVIPITAEGRFTTDPIPPGKYIVGLFAALASTPRLSPQLSDFSAHMTFEVPENGDVPEIEILAKANPPQDLSKVTDLRVRVVDEDGHPLSKFQAMVQMPDRWSASWIDGGAGMVILGGASAYRESNLDVLVRAEGYASTVARFDIKQRDKLSSGVALMTVRRGRKVQLRFNLPNAMSWPKGVLPEAYFDVMQSKLRAMRQPVNQREVIRDDNMLNLHEVSEGRFEFWLAENTPPFHVAIHSPGFLQHFETGPFTLADVKEGSLTIDIPRPATLDVSFEPGDYPGSDAPFKTASLTLDWRIQGDGYLNVASTIGPGKTPRLKVTDLAPGDYSISVRTEANDDSQPHSGTKINVGKYSDRKSVALTSGQAERIDFRSKPFDPNIFRGSQKAVVRVRMPDGQPAKIGNVSITYYDGHYGHHDVFSGSLPESGEIVLNDITDTVPPSSSLRSPYTITLDGKRLGTFALTREGKQDFEFHLAPGIGDLAPDIELTSLKTGKPIRLSGFRGKVVFLEFWATWCGPCQQPMTKLNVLCDEQSAAWKDRVAIVPVGIDSEQSRILSHVHQRGWTALEHFWSSRAEGGDFNAPAALAFVVSGVPEAILIGTDGRILWRGHPLRDSSGENLKSRIEAALKQE